MNETLDYDDYLNWDCSLRIQNIPWSNCMEVCLETYLENVTPFMQHIYQYDTSAADDCNCRVFVDSHDFSFKLRNVAQWFVKKMDEINRARAAKRAIERAGVP